MTFEAMTKSDRTGRRALGSNVADQAERPPGTPLPEFGRGSDIHNLSLDLTASSHHELDLNWPDHLNLIVDVDERTSNDDVDDVEAMGKCDRKQFAPLPRAAEAGRGYSDVTISAAPSGNYGEARRMLTDAERRYDDERERRISNQFTRLITEDQDTAIKIAKEIAKPLDAIMKLGFEFVAEFISHAEDSKRVAAAEVHDIILRQEELLAQIQLKCNILAEIEQSVIEIEHNHGSLGELKQKKRVLEQAMARAKEQEKVMELEHTQLVKHNEQLSQQVSLARDQNQKLKKVNVELQQDANEASEQHLSLLEQNRQQEQQLSLAREQNQKLIAQNTLLQQDTRRATEQRTTLQSTLRALFNTNSTLRAHKKKLCDHNEMIKTSINSIMEANNKFQDQIVALQGEMENVDDDATEAADDFEQQRTVNAPREGFIRQDLHHGVTISPTRTNKRDTVKLALAIVDSGQQRSPPSKRHKPS